MLEQIHEVQLHGKKYIIFRMGKASEWVPIRKFKRYVCPICESIIQPDDGKLYLIAGDMTTFPNRVVHAPCFDKDASPVAIKNLLQNWNDAQKYAHWFD